MKHPAGTLRLYPANWPEAPRPSDNSQPRFPPGNRSNQRATRPDVQVPVPAVVGTEVRGDGAYPLAERPTVHEDAAAVVGQVEDRRESGMSGRRSEGDPDASLGQRGVPHQGGSELLRNAGSLDDIGKTMGLGMRS